jgi:hypothetical protein
MRQLHEDRDNHSGATTTQEGARSWGKHSRDIAPY